MMGRFSIVQSDITARRKLSEGPALGGWQSISNRCRHNSKLDKGATSRAPRCAHAARARNNII
jgi:hypothetical protein